MAIVFDGPVTPDALTAFVREVPTPSTHVLNTLLPDRPVDRNSVDFSDLTRTNRTARFRAYDGRLHVSERDAGSTRSVKLPPLSSSVSTGELERLQLEFARTGGGNTQAFVDAIYDDATNLTREVQNRMELARGDVLTDFKFTMSLDGEPLLEADFGAPAGHLPVAATPWTTTASASIVSDELAWVNTYVATNGFAPGGQIVSRRVLNLMLQNAELRSLAASLAGTPGLITRRALNDSLDAYGIPPIQLIYDTKVDVDGVVTSVLPDTRVLYVPPAGQDLGYTAWGVSATALELVGSNAVDFDFSDAAGIVGVVEKSGPPYREWSFVDAVGMPVIAQPRRLLVATVA